MSYFIAGMAFREVSFPSYRGGRAESRHSRGGRRPTHPHKGGPKMTPLYDHVTLLAMELDRSHVGALVQIITEDWSITGTLSRLDQHDAKEWDIDYANGGRLVPRLRDIQTGLTIGPWTGKVQGNQPVTVERVAASIAEANLEFIQAEIERGIIPKSEARRRYYPDGMGEDPPDVIRGDLE